MNNSDWRTAAGVAQMQRFFNCEKDFSVPVAPPSSFSTTDIVENCAKSERVRGIPL